MCGYMRLDIVSNEVIREKVEVVFIEDKTKEIRLKLFEHSRRRSENAPVRVSERINLLECRRGKGRPKKS